MRVMNRQGLYWPNGRNQFRRRPPTGARVALWIVIVATVMLAAWGCVHAQ
jgi:hypothetical protein